MPPNRVQQRATTHVRVPRVCLRQVAKLTRVTVGMGPNSGRTLHFTMPGGKKGTRSAVTFIDPENVPEFEGKEAWFEVEQVERGAGRMWPWWRAVRQVDPPEGAR